MTISSQASDLHIVKVIVTRHLEDSPLARIDTTKSAVCSRLTVPEPYVTVVLLPTYVPLLSYMVPAAQPCAVPQKGPGTMVSALPVSKSKVKPQRSPTQP